jgi:hypothetical protein
MLYRTDFARFNVMPAKAGIQENSAVASDYGSWIPGLALLARK